MSASPRARMSSAISGALMRVRGDHGNLYRFLDPPRRPREARARHRLRDGRDARLVPADAGAEDRRARFLDRSGELHRFGARQAAFHQVERGDAEHDDEIRARRGARLAHDFAGKAHAVLERAAPVVPALVGALREELRDQVALRAHDLDAVVTRRLCEHRAAHEVADRLPDFRRGQFARRVRIDAGLDRRGRNDPVVVAVTPGMQQLQHDAPARLVNRARNVAVSLRILLGAHLRPVRRKLARVVRRKAAGDDQRGAAARALRIERGQSRYAVGPRLEARVHRAHQDAVRQRRAGQLERAKEVGIGRHVNRMQPAFYPRVTSTVPARMRTPPASALAGSASPRNSQPHSTPNSGIR